MKNLILIPILLLSFTSVAQMKIEYKIEQTRNKGSEVILTLNTHKFNGQDIGSSTQDLAFSKKLVNKTLIKTLQLRKNAFDKLIGYCFVSYTRDIDLESVSRPKFCQE